MKINIKVKEGFWQVNGKPLKECNFMEREFMNNYFRELKIDAIPTELKDLHYGKKNEKSHTDLL